MWLSQDLNPILNRSDALTTRPLNEPHWQAPGKFSTHFLQSGSPHYSSARSVMHSHIHQRKLISGPLPPYSLEREGTRNRFPLIDGGVLQKFNGSECLQLNVNSFLSIRKYLSRKQKLQFMLTNWEVD